MNRTDEPTHARSGSGQCRSCAGGWWRTPVFLCLVLALVTVAVYWPVLGFDFINCDDPENISANPLVQSGLSWRNVVWAFTTDYNCSWYPVTWLSFMLDVQCFGRGAWGPHLTNLLLHVGNTVLVYLLLRRLTKSHWRSAVVAGLFALHPLRVETVAWVADRRDLLSAFFGFLSLIFYARYAQERVRGPWSVVPYLASLLCLALGLMSKPMLVTLPFVLLLLDYWPLRRISDFRPARDSSEFQLSAFRFQLWRLVWEKLPFLALSAASCVVTVMVYRGAGAIGGGEGPSLMGRVANALVSYARYLGKTIWPFELALFHPAREQWPVWVVVLAVVLVVGLSGVAVWQARRRPYLFTGWFWFVGILVPVIGLVNWLVLGICEHFTYVPLVGIFVLVAWGLGELVVWRVRLKPAVVLVVGLVLVGCVWRTQDQVWHWQNSETLHRHALRVVKDNWMAHNYLGSELVNQGRMEEALVHFRRALELRPDDVKVLGNLGAAMMVLGRSDEALAGFRRALAVDPNYAPARLNLGNLFFKLGNLAAAEAEYQELLRRNPADVQAHMSLGDLLASQRRYDVAVEHYRTACSLAPADAYAQWQLGRALLSQGKIAEAIPCLEIAASDSKLVEARLDLGYALLRLGKEDAAMRHFRFLLQNRPDHAGAHDGLGAALAMTGQFDEALVHFRESLRLSPGRADAHFNLGNALAMQRRLEEAVREYREALRLQPDHAPAQLGLGTALVDLGRREEAIPHLGEALRLQPDYPQAREQLRALGVK